MASKRNSLTIYILTAIVSLVGLADSIYLTVEHLAGRSVRCTIDSRAINATLAFVRENCCGGFSMAESAQPRRVRATH